ncbi:hypothetical protein BGX38DRAFT_1280178 [Terfezia claveryi]|nr:hypothetical protein BGX38DRAFT_1280178 [Terfezia claveryi]
MPLGKKSKGKEKAMPNLKHPASTHDLRQETTTADGDSTGPVASSQFSAVIKFSSRAAAVNSCSGEIPNTTGSVRETEPPAEGPAMTPDPKNVAPHQEHLKYFAHQLARSGDTPDGSPLRSLFSNWNGVSSPTGPLESPISMRPPMGQVDGTSSRISTAEVAKTKKRTQSITQFPGVLRDITESAGNRIEYITLFEELFPDPQRTEDILAELRSVQSRTRLHLVSEAKKNIAFLYQFDRNTSKEYIQNHVGRLLKRDRFTCAESLQKSCGYRFRTQEGVDLIYLQYFNGKKKLGNIDSIFIKRISGAFICFIFTALYHALSGWESGECQLVAEFSYLNCSDVYKRLLEQWRLYPTSVQDMIVKQQDKPYEVDAEEVAEFSRKLTADLRKVGIDLFQGGRKEDDTESTTEEDIWEGNDPTRIEEEEEDSIEGNSNARNDHRAEEEEDAEDAEEGEGMPSGQKEYRGTGGRRAWEEED